jgi:hypothetical protein
MLEKLFGITHALKSPIRLSQKMPIGVLSSLGYACFMVLFPWTAISRSGFPDYDNYVYDFNYLIFKDTLFVDFYNILSPVQYFTREVLWFELMRWLTDITGEASIALRIISFIIFFIWGHFLFRRVSYGVALLFLFNPYLIDVALSSIRNGLAWAFFIVGLGTRSKTLTAALFLTGMFTHSSVLVLAIFYYFTQFASRYIKGKTLLLGGLGVGIFIGLGLTVGNELVLGAIGDRRVGENYLAGSGSLIQASLWSILLFFQCTSGRSYIRDNILVITVLAWYLTMVPFVSFSSRILGAFLPVIAVSAMNLSPRKRQIFVFLYFGYVVLQYFYWTKLLNYLYLV